MTSPDGELVRVVRLRRGSLKPAEFQLRPGEKGLSMFLADPALSSDQLLRAVRDAGKQGELAVALVPVRIIRELGLNIVATEGGTPDPEVNRYHREIRIKWLLRVWLRIRRVSLHEFFNDRYPATLCKNARLED